VVKLGDGLAVTFSDISEAKATQERYAHLAEVYRFGLSERSLSIVARMPHGLITAMNVAAEKLTGYSREELVGKAPLTALHDERELLEGRSVSILRRRSKNLDLMFLPPGWRQARWRYRSGL